MKTSYRDVSAVLVNENLLKEARRGGKGQFNTNSIMELAFIVFLFLEPNLSGQGNVLVVRDHFTCFTNYFQQKANQDP